MLQRTSLLEDIKRKMQESATATRNEIKSAQCTTQVPRRCLKRRGAVGRGGECRCVAFLSLLQNGVPVTLRGLID